MGLIVPNYFIVEPTRVCNFKCFMCPNRFYNSTEKGHMSFELFRNIIDNINLYAKVIQLYWMGEPFLNPSLFDMIEYIKTKTKATVIISTNGSQLNTLNIDHLINSKLDVLIIDVDSGDSEEIYSKIRMGGDFKKLLISINALLERNSKIKVILQFLQFKFNIHQAKKFVNRWSNKCCELRFSWIDTWANQMPELRGVAHKLSPYEHETRKSCSDLWHKVTINYKGDVNLCCHDFHGIYKLGNLATDDLLTVWNSEEISKIRKEHIQGKYDGLCKNCIEWAKECEYEELL